MHDRLHELDEGGPGRVPAMEALDVGIGVHEGDSVGAPLEVVVEVGEATVELGAELATDQAGRGRVDRELGKPVEEVELAGLAPETDHALDLVGDGGGVAAHELVA